MSKSTVNRWVLRIGLVGAVAPGAGWASGHASAASLADIDGALAAAVGYWSDSNGDQIRDTFIGYLWADDTLDLLAIDADQNGLIEALAIDLDNDGLLETVALDFSGNGVFDGYALDIDNDNWENIFGDFDEDGNPDFVPVGSPISLATQQSMNEATINSTFIPMVYDTLAAAGL